MAGYTRLQRHKHRLRVKAASRLDSTLSEFDGHMRSGFA